MRFSCPGCQVIFSVPDEKIPEGRTLRLLCPKCRLPIEWKGGMMQAAEAGGVEKTVDFSSPRFDEALEEDSALDYVDEGVKTSLVCVSDGGRARRVEQILHELDFYVSMAASTKLALDKLHNNVYQFVVLDEDFDRAKLSQNLVLHHVQLLPMHIRRQFFLCLLSETIRTLDRLAAFRIGVDMILNLQDFEKAKILLIRSMKEHKAFYRVFFSELEKKTQF